MRREATSFTFHLPVLSDGKRRKCSAKIPVPLIEKYFRTKQAYMDISGEKSWYKGLFK
jgi:hypothetical protein